ncbi:MAG: malto-oligosyltrehalose trehalohydrolase [Pirellulaceae bacterium]|nr:malto-oligosyltrehalose trehalohydrolase [Pirellulaceae bacterium]
MFDNQDTSLPSSSFSYRFGPLFHDDGTVTFRVWAPRLDSLAIRLATQVQSTPMTRDEQGVFAVRLPAGNGDRYWIELPNGALRPDPASRFQPDGVHGPSQLVNTRLFAWQVNSWQGVPKKSLIIYEMHLGTVTKGGTYATAIEDLDRLVALGVTAIELMPIAETAGARNWGYDGVNLYAPRNSYGPPELLQRFIDAAHQRGLAVILDVVYNHFGPEGNYLHELGGCVSQTHRTAWGDAPNFDAEGSRLMRDFIVENAIYWIEEFRFDGLRLDAIHCMADDSKEHIVSEIGQAVAKLRTRLNRELCLIAESNVYDPELLQPLSAQGYGFDAEWCDDFLHSVFAVLKPGDQMSTRKYLPFADLDLVLKRGFVFHATLHSERKRIPVTADLPRTEFESLIFAIQNHDFIGNHPSGRRLQQIAGHDAQRAVAALLLLLPAIPMLFMGEEFASNSPFQFFTDFTDAHIRTAVEVGRRKEYPQHNWADSPSPLDESVFRNSFIGEEPTGSAQTLQWYKDLIRIRKQWIQAELLSSTNLHTEWDAVSQVARVIYRNESHVGEVLVRLHMPDTPPQPLRHYSIGDLNIQAGFDHAESEGGEYCSSPFAVFVASTLR